MKYVKYLTAFAAGMVMLSSCTDDFVDTFNTVEKPNTLAQLEYLNAYAPLKEALRGNMSRSINPNFLLGSGVTASEYVKRTGVYALTNSNFDQVTAGNAMKYASIVNDQGEMNFANVIDFVSAATNAGLQVYGHTLCWHAQQNVTWLNSLIADRELPNDPSQGNEIVDYRIDYSEQDSYGFWGQWGKDAVASINKEGGYLQIENTTPVNFWEVQFMIADNFQLVKGQNYKLKVEACATGEGALQGNVGSWNDNVGMRLGFGTDWEVLEMDFTAATDEGSHVLAQCGDFIGTVMIKSVEITHQEAPAVEFETIEERECIQVITDEMVDAAWDSQFWLVFEGITFNEGDKWEVSMDVRALKDASIGTQVHKEPGGYLHWSAIGNVPFKQAWTTFTASGTCDANWNGGYSIAFNLNDYSGANEYFFDDISFKLNGQELIKNGSCDMGGSTESYVSKEMRGELVPSRLVDKAKIIMKGNTKPLTTEEKAEILTNEMERWIKGMMDATEGKVKAWDVVNEAISGGPWGQKYDLQHGSAASKTDFFWQDYLGDNFVRIPVKFARQYFAEQEGANPDDLKLFINDYNLESDWDDNQKLKSLIMWIEQWESDGETKIDGIGTQMHVSYHMNPATQASKEEHVVKMFELMAATGKLCRITELDMGICDEEGKAIKTADVTFEQQKQMAKYYNFIITKYFEIIPEAQQYGICQWAQTDSPENSGWRGGEPIGLWDLNYTRKPTYGGFADGLMGRPTE